MNPAPERTIGNLAQLACTWEVLARKAGNVCPGREFPDLTVNDFLVSAAAIAPILDQAPYQPLGVTILRCIEETRKVVNTNTNLGIVLLLAPLASVSLDQPLMPGLSQVLARTTVEDSRNVYAAIRLAKPGGLGEVNDQDVREEPTLPLREVMALAKDRDEIAKQYENSFFWILNRRHTFWQWVDYFQSVERAVVELQVSLLAYGTMDSLVLRKKGAVEAKKVGECARSVHFRGLDTPPGQQAFRDFDAWLRSENHARNPGTTADLIVAVLFVVLRERLIDPAIPFDWTNHPFQTGA